VFLGVSAAAQEKTVPLPGQKGFFYPNHVVNEYMARVCAWISGETTLRSVDSNPPGPWVVSLNTFGAEGAGIGGIVVSSSGKFVTTGRIKNPRLVHRDSLSPEDFTRVAKLVNAVTSELPRNYRATKRRCNDKPMLHVVIQWIGEEQHMQTSRLTTPTAECLDDPIPERFYALAIALVDLRLNDDFRVCPPSTQHNQ
jgi:hypothetical protein